MAIRAAELQVVIGADSSPAVQGIRGAMGLISGAASTALGVFSGTLMTQAVGALGNLASAGVQAVGEFERMSATLGTLVKRDLVNTGQSLDQVGVKTQELLNWVQQLAKESPFDASGVTMALRTAMAYGFTAEQAQRLTQATIDYAAGSGQSTEAMNSIALALGQIQAKGKLAGQEVLQLVNAGIDVRAALAKYLGKSTQEVAEMMEKGMIDANTAIEAIISTLEKDFGGAAKEQANTVSGLLSTLGELKQMGLRELFTGIVDAVRPLAEAFIDWLQESGIEKIRKIGKSIGELAKKLIDFGQRAAPTFQTVMEWVKEHGHEIAGAITGIAIAFGAMAIVAGVTALVSALANPLIWIVALMGLLGAAWAGNWGGMRDKITEAWEGTIKPAITQIVAWLRSNIPIALNTLRSVWSSVWAAVQAVVAAVLPIICALIAAFQAALQGDWYAFGADLRKAWDTVWKNLSTVISAAWAGIKVAITTLINNIITTFGTTDWASVGRKILEGIANGIKAGSQWLINTVASVVNAAVNTVKGLLGIQSPSKLFEIEIAGNMMKGWIRGIEKMTPRLQTSVALAVNSIANPPTMTKVRTLSEGWETNFYAPVIFRVENEQTMRELMRGLR